VRHLRVSLIRARRAALAELPDHTGKARRDGLAPVRAAHTVTRCTLGATLVDVGRGATSWAFRGVREAADRGEAEDALVTGLVGALLSKSRLPRARITTTPAAPKHASR